MLQALLVPAFLPRFGVLCLAAAGHFSFELEDSSTCCDETTESHSTSEQAHLGDSHCGVCTDYRVGEAWFEHRSTSGLGVPSAPLVTAGDADLFLDAGASIRTIAHPGSTLDSPTLSVSLPLLC